MGDYFSQFNNQKIEEILTKRQNILILEELINQETKLRINLESKKLNCGKLIRIKDLDDIIPTIANKVNFFLNTPNIKCCKVNYFERKTHLFIKNIQRGINLTPPILSIITGNPFFLLFYLYPIRNLNLIFNEIPKHSFKEAYYNINKYVDNTIELEQDFLNHLIPTIAHEYTPPVQWETGIGKKIYFSSILEGHAYGVMKEIAKDYRENENNESYLYKINKISLAQLKITYKVICNQLGLTPNKRLNLENLTTFDRINEKYLIKNKTIPYEAIGNSLFHILELLYGKEIYHQIIHQQFQLP